MYNACVPVKLQSFYLRYVYRGFTLNAKRAKWTPNLSPLGNMCGLVDETFIHSFWECSSIQHLWRKLIDWCKLVIDPDAVYSKENCLLLGFKSHLLNVIMTIMKYHLHLLRTFHDDFIYTALDECISVIRARDINSHRQLPYLKVDKMLALWHPTLKHN